MHFAKVYSQLLLTLPPELQENAIEYRQLKKLINKVVGELASLGLSPSVLQTLLQPDESTFSSGSAGKGKQRAFGERSGELISSGFTTDPHDVSPTLRSARTKAVYEVVHDGDHIHPRLRIRVGTPNSEDSTNADVDGDDVRQNLPASPPVDILVDAPDCVPIDGEYDAQEKDLMLVLKPIIVRPEQSLIWTLQKRTNNTELGNVDPLDAGKGDGSGIDMVRPEAHPVESVRRQLRVSAADGSREFIIPLQSDMAFFELLYSALQTLSSTLSIVHSNFINNLESLARTISQKARPQSTLHTGFHPWSSHSDPRSVTAPLISPLSMAFMPSGKSKSDLYTWREIFQLYMETEVFESMHELDRGERDVAEAERRLALFAEQVTARALNDKRNLLFKESRDALEKFLQLNVLILNLKKFQFANAEAARKILKKHTKRTALPFPISHLEASAKTVEINSQVLSLRRTHHPGDSQTDILTLIPTSKTSLAHLLVQAVGETLLPIIPHLDDYSCLICTSIAFKPIRLDCGHLFCVRCLIKMQKRGQDHCPCCRAPTVLKADRSNVDWAMLNFMQDWFPRETAQKLKQNEKEAAQEQLEELGIPDQGCIVA
ncbi:hypothetical protein ACEPAI_4757 [Sanghuangporus weigelae]